VVGNQWYGVSSFLAHFAIRRTEIWSLLT
jgi:hypothetical protein